jgi:hypothetical protein
MLIFSYIFINLELKEIMYLNVSSGDNAIFQEHRIQ